MRRPVLLLLVMAILLPCSGSLLAQAQPQPLAQRRPPLGPVGTKLGLLSGPDTTPLQRATPVGEFLSPVFMSRGGRRQGTVLMIVGGAGILAGLLLNEDIITVAGAGVAGVGLYFYLR
jgi:hypothetical protein